MAKKVRKTLNGYYTYLNDLLQKGKGPKGKGSGSRDDPAWARTDVIEREHMHNERLEKYYKAQNILPEQEWDQFLNAMRDPLPTTFRVAGSRQQVPL